jgi:hypothetical protein
MFDDARRVLTGIAAEMRGQSGIRPGFIGDHP